MRFLFGLGCLLLLATILLLGFEVVIALQEGSYRLVPLGEIWFRLDQMLGIATLNTFQAAVQRHVWVGLWDGVLQPLLTQPAWIVTVVPAVLLVFIGRTLRRKR